MLLQDVALTLFNFKRLRLAVRVQLDFAPYALACRFHCVIAQ